MLIETTRVEPWNINKDIRYTDVTVAEQERGISIISTPISLVLPDSRDKSHLMNFIDTPGHISLTGEVTASISIYSFSSPGLRVSDGCLVCIDAIEGVMMNTERCIRHAISQGVSIVVAFTKMDRLITDLKLPPNDAYYKLVAMLEDVNTIIDSCSQGLSLPRINPLNNNVIFCSGLHRWSFTLLSYARHYQRVFGIDIPVESLARRLWGNVWFNYETRRFEGKTADTRAPRSFVQFCLEPM